MKINILLPYKEQFDLNNASSVSITIKNNLFYAKYKDNIKVFGKAVDNPISKENFVGIKDDILMFKSKNKFLATKMCKNIILEEDKVQLIEIHNRPYLLNYIYNTVH